MNKPPDHWTVLSMLKWATTYFKEKGIRNPRYSIEWLLAFVLDKKRLDLYLVYDRPITKKELSQLKPLVQRRAVHEPLQYITGETDFFGTKITVKPGVLIPRMETEQLMEIVLDKTAALESPNVLDIGTGSGCIPIALKNSRPNWNLFATDISEEALSIAQQNAALNGTDITFAKDDIYSPSFPPEKILFDVIISNPPYILKDEHETLDKEVREFEPELALFCDSTKYIYGAIQKFSTSFLNKNGLLFLELHENHADEVARLFTQTGWSTTIQKDYDKRDRFLIAKK
ncbi:MAG: peptide chain release factor N(5)-glutamine methyltransferase [Balneolaceae bacterium]